MTLQDAIAQGPAWVGIWLNVLMLGGFVIPAILLIWKSTRWAGIFTLIAGIASAVGVGWMFEQMGYVKLLGLPHVLFYTPLAYYLWQTTKNDDIPVWPKRLIWVSLIIILISLAFDYTDVLRYLLGNRGSLV